MVAELEVVEGELDVDAEVVLVAVLLVVEVVVVMADVDQENVAVLKMTGPYDPHVALIT